MASERALVTGACGFIGRHIARELKQRGYFVVGIGHGTWDLGESREFGVDEWHGTDVTLDALNIYAGEPVLIAHCAGSGSVSYSMTHPYEDFRRSVDTCAAVLEYARTRAPDAGIVIPSSAGVYGGVDALPIHESTIPRPGSAYGAHKLICEQLATSYATHFGLKIAVVRLFSVYGRGLRKQLLWDACTKLSHGDRTFFGTGDEVRDWIHVGDAATLMLAAVEHSRPGAICTVNGGSGIAVINREILTHLFRCFGRDDSPIFGGAGRLGDPQRYQADTTKAQTLGWHPSFEWRAGVADFVTWFKGVTR
jgi:UDP-glucose 4-epimerase